jgi:Uma2 family endonuclease
MSTSPQSPVVELDLDDEDMPPRPDISHLITEDDTPVDNLFSEKQMRLLTTSLVTSWKPDFPFITMANVGVYIALNRPPIVPDVMVKLDVLPAPDPTLKEYRAYFSWMYDGKPPEIVVEIVSNKKGGELSTKQRNYEHIGVAWYIVHDPFREIQDEAISAFHLVDGKYQRCAFDQLGDLGLGVKEWEGEFEGSPGTYLRWTDRTGTVLMTGDELAAKNAQLAAKNAQLAAKNAQTAAKNAQRTAVLEAKLRALGIDPDSVS